MRSLVHSFLLPAIFGLWACNNYGLIEKLENPGSTSNERFTDRLFIFVTSQMTAGDMFALTAGSCTGTGIGKADCVCQALAIQNGLRLSADSKYLAWLSTTSEAMNCRFGGAMGLNCAPVGTQIWYNTNFEPVFFGIESATTGLLGGTPTLAASPRYTESRELVPSMPDNVWTGTNPGGNGSTSNCNGWTANTSGFFGQAGQSDSNSGTWTSSTSFGCDLFKRIYCVAVP